MAVKRFQAFVILPVIFAMFYVLEKDRKKGIIRASIFSLLAFCIFLVSIKSALPLYTNSIPIQFKMEVENNLGEIPNAYNRLHPMLMILPVAAVILVLYNSFDKKGDFRVKEKEMIPVILWFLITFLMPAFYSLKEPRYVLQAMGPGIILSSHFLKKMNRKVVWVLLIWLAVDAIIYFPDYSSYINPFMTAL